VGPAASLDGCSFRHIFRPVSTLRQKLADNLLVAFSLFELVAALS